jgi:hypothetical protein
VRKAIGGENGSVVDAAIPDAMHSATIIGPERLRHTMKILHVVAVVHKSRLLGLRKYSSEKGKTLCRLCKWEKIIR